MKNIRVKKVGTGLSVALGIGLTALVGSSIAQLVCPEPAQEGKPDTIGSLKGVPVPLPAALDSVVKNRTKAIALGKAWFWDKQVGSDGQACASCHSHAGADGRRITNQLNPGMNANPPDLTFNLTKTGGRGPNYTFKSADFPFHVLSDPLDRESVTFDTNDIATSQGVYSGAGPFQQFFGLNSEVCSTTDGAPFVINGKRTRATPPRNTPTTINAIFQFRSFWDGRANNHFNGVDPFGRRNPNARVLVNNGGTVVPEILDLENAALASQAVGPVLSTLEASCADRGFQKVGRKLLNVIPRPLHGQKVDPTDSVLGQYAHATAGLKDGVTYRTLIQEAFQDKYWNAPGYDAQANETTYTLMEENFSLFWGIAVMLYESTLVSDQTPFDKYMGNATTPPDFTKLTAQQINGMSLFIGKGKCVNCHKGPDFTGAGVRLQAEFQEGGIVERMEMAANGVALYDNGFYNIGARPSREDLGVGGTDPFGHPLSFTRQYKKRLAGTNVPDSFQINTCTFESDPCQTITNSNHRDAVDGAFKTPTLRNVELTGPYMHNGGMATLEQVIDFYNRGGDRRGQDGDDTTGFNHSQWGHNRSNLDPDITQLGLTSQEKADLVAFLKSLTDERVRCEEAPFDHPALANFNGHSTLDANNDGRLDELTMRLPAVGAGGLKTKGLACLKPFLQP